MRRSNVASLRESGEGGSFKMSEDTKKSSAAMILLAWVLVSVPLGWGVYNTLLNSMKLFQAPVAAPASAAPRK
jgi:hypothetical protein